MNKKLMNYCRTLIVCWLFASYSKAFSQNDDKVGSWIRNLAVPFDHSIVDFGSMEKIFSQARVIGLGEATHGQHEVFEIKRQLTMHLIRNHGIRMVAYEASASQMMKANKFVSGTSDDWKAAMNGFGMLIWQVEEALVRWVLSNRPLRFVNARCVQTFADYSDQRL